jgi:hypothetical protein
VSRAPLLLGAFALLAALAALFVGLEPTPELDVRAIPHQTQFGRIFPGHPVGASFVLERGDLRALEIALVDLGGERTPLELTLRGELGGEVLRRVAIPASDLPTGDGWVRVELDLAALDASPRSFHFELSSASPSSHSPWVRYRGVPHLVRPWGDRVLPGGALEFELSLLPHPDLCALALAVDGLDAAAAPAFVQVADPRTGEVVVRGEVRQRSPQASAWVFFTFEALAPSRWKPWNVRFELPADARPIGAEGGPSLIAFHGRGRVDEALRGMTCGPAHFEDRDLIFRARGAESRGLQWARWLERGGARLPAAAALFVAAALALAALLHTWSFGRRDPSEGA